MGRYFTKTFRRFVVGFLVIIAAAFGVIIAASQYFPQGEPQSAPVDNVALPR